MPGAGTAVLSARGVVPPHVYDQDDITAELADVVLGGAGADPRARALLAQVHASAGVRTRHLVRPLGEYRDLGGFSASNDVFVTEALALAERAAREALEAAGCTPEDVDVVMSTTVTGLAVPSLEARLVHRLGLRPDVKRLPVFGLGCVAGAAGVARLHDHLSGGADRVALLLSVELCSLTLQADDASRANLVASGLFGDGAAAVVLRGGADADRLPGGVPRVIATRSRLYPGTERTMGWDIGTSGFRIVLDAGVPDLVREHLGDDVKTFLADHHLDLADVTTWVAHPGGPKVLRAMEETLALDDDALALTWRSLAAVGNLSSASVLHVLEATLRERTPPPGSHGLLLAMGPGFCAELVLLQW
ncbi:type III polyketide synthase [Aquipuribacter nitratireducens]|uniref:Type III polyketide synthase n=1 Tax=Aquipuribacter nitratireducens TaxID=650104 RepID=A0ABW0GNI8_9MICO